MNLKKSLLCTISLFLAGLLLSGSELTPGACGAEKEMKPVLVASASGVDRFWEGIERIGEVMGYKDNVVGFRMVFGETQGVDTTKPLGFIVLANEKDYVAYSFFPVADFDALEIGMLDKSTWNINEEKGRRIFISEDGKRMELIQRDGWLFVVEEGKGELIPAGDPSELTKSLNEDFLIGVKVDPAHCPKALLDTLFAWFRQQSANTDASVLEQMNRLSAFVTLLSEDVISFDLGLNIDDNGNLSLVSSIKPEPGTEFAKAMEQSVSMKTKWSSLFESDAVFAGYLTEASTPELKEYTRESYQISFDNMLSEMEIYLDEDDNIDLVKGILSDFQAIVEDMLVRDKVDGAVSLTQESILMFGSDMTDTDKAREFLKKLQTWIQESEPELADKFVLDAPAVGEYQVSTFILPFDDIAALSETVAMASLFEERELAFVVGVGKDSVIMLAGLDAETTLAKFNEVAAAPVTETELPEIRSYLAFPKLGELLSVFISAEANESDFLPVLAKIMSNASAEARIEGRAQFNDGAILNDCVVKGECFAMIGDLIRAVASEEAYDPDLDESELFEEEETAEEEEAL
ncbi:MAG: hypothetical protein Q4G68_09490 [Planctomycetia bacterium]|nr:hypothetical protein [Planctomycetia bacterium]